MNSIRVFFIIYLVAVTGVSIASIFVPFFPGTEVISWFIDADGRFPVFLVLGTLFLMFLLPMVIVLFFVNRLLSIKSVKEEELIDQVGVEITRQKALYGGVYGIEIYINDKKKGTVMIGKPLRLALPYGEQVIFAKSMKKVSAPISIVVSENEKTHLIVGFELVNGAQQLFLRDQLTSTSNQ